MNLRERAAKEFVRAVGGANATGGVRVLAPTGPAAGVLLLGQLVAYALGGLSLLLPSVAGWTPARLAGFFLLVNASMLVAWGYHLAGYRAVVWEPTRR